jgi:hypothetical protein
MVEENDKIIRDKMMAERPGEISGESFSRSLSIPLTNIPLTFRFLGIRLKNLPGIERCWAVPL